MALCYVASFNHVFYKNTLTRSLDKYYIKLYTNDSDLFCSSHCQFITYWENKP